MMSGPRIIDLASRRDYSAKMLLRLEAHEGFHSVAMGYGLANAIRLFHGGVPFEHIRGMFIVYRRSMREEWIAGIDEMRSVPGQYGAVDLVLAPFVPFTQTGIRMPIQLLGVHMLMGASHRALAFRPRRRLDDICSFEPPLLPPLPSCA